MNNEQRMAEMEKRLRNAFAPSELSIYDDSDSHIGHAGAESGAGHFMLTIRSQAFEGLNPIACHQRIYRVLDDMMGPEIHALSIDAKATSAVK